MGADSSITFAMLGSELNDAAKEPKKPRLGLFAHNITQGNKPLTKNTAIMIPHNKNHFLPFLDIVERTSALITALSMLITISKRLSPKRVRIIENQLAISAKKSYSNKNIALLPPIQQYFRH